MKSLLIATLLSIVCLTGYTQDQIHKKDKTVIECKVVEIGLNEVKYKELNMEDSPIISIGVDMLVKVVLSNGREIVFKDPLTDPVSYVDDKKSALKLHFLSPLLEHLSFSHEKSLRPGRSLESDLGIIGLGFDTDQFSKSRGVVLGTGYKFMKTPDFYSQRLKYAHILKGAYVKPQVLVSIYRNEYEPDLFFGNVINPDSGEQNVFAGALLINIGKQVIYDNSFLIDYSFGLGYGYSNQNNRNNDFSNRWRAYHYGYVVADQDTPLAVTFKVKVGFLL